MDRHRIRKNLNPKVTKTLAAIQPTSLERCSTMVQDGDRKSKPVLKDLPTSKTGNGPGLADGRDITKNGKVHHFDPGNTYEGRFRYAK